ncbi:GEVED domain-containing protein [Taibaiella soli]|uniref:Uncharacterized protein n=1 Tax=Taibaiella soli TaxID=1649169 RepID=A0A2W2BFH1_9BACT|nr:GEVED domain-containing protein [Taibaiella soli]PZF74617.1 hypothetical protein DN068_03300 [Taibaiella soli]
MKIFPRILPLLFLGISSQTKAQTYYYSFPLYSIINSMPGGTKLPDGTIVKVDKISTGGGTHTDTSGTKGTGHDMGGTFTGKTLAAYTGSKDSSEFTVIQGNTQTIDNGEANNCAASIGFHVYFDRPTANINFLALDIDGAYNGPGVSGNAEWVSSMAFNGTAFVPYTQTTSTTVTPVLTARKINIGASHSWRTLVTNSVSAAAAANIPASNYYIQTANVNNLQPDDLNSQVFFNPTTATDLVTDFFCMWGIWPKTNNVGQQRSGVSPIIVSVKSDFGDDPDSYKTLLASGGPSHGVLPGLSLGNTNEPKLDGQPSAAANLDINDDGVANVPAIINTPLLTTQTISSYTIITTFNNNTGRDANLVCWIDWNGDGTFDPSEAITATVPASTTSGSVPFTWNNVTLSGAGGAMQTYARIRLTTGAITTSDVGGAFSDGEVEDYRIPFVAPLVITLGDFKGNIINGHAQLNWNTLEEKDAQSFVVEYAANGADFNKVGEVTAVGSGANSYSFTDDNPARNINYYRLRMRNNDGTETSSKIIALKSANMIPFAVTIAPNPVSNNINLVTTSETALTVQVYNILGKIVYTGKMFNPSYSSVDCSGFTPGTYFMKVTSDAGETQTLQFVKN